VNNIAWSIPRRKRSIGRERDVLLKSVPAVLGVVGVPIAGQSAGAGAGASVYNGAFRNFLQRSLGVWMPHTARDTKRQYRNEAKPAVRV